MMNPKRRFKKADGTIFADWKNVPFANIFQEYNVKNTACLPQYTAGKYGLKPIDNEKIRYNIQNHKAFSINSLILGIGIEEVGVATNYPGCVSPIYTTYQIQDHKANSLFIAYYIKNVFAKNKGRITHKSTRREYEFEPTELKKIDIPLPDSLEEQEKIANFLFEIDNLIASAEAEIEKTKNFKKAMLQKMFPKDGESVPEIRFPGFTDDWEQRKLADVAEIIGGGTPSTSNPDYWDGDIDWYAPAEIGEQIFAYGSVRKITKEGLIHSSAKILPAHKTVLFTSRAGIGNMAILKRPAATNQGFQSLVCHDDIDPYFMFSMGDSIKAKAERVAAGSTFAEISGKKLGELEFMFPDTDEQKAISVYFKNLDHLITLHQRKANAYKKLKKAMMQQLFV